MMVTDHTKSTSLLKPIAADHEEVLHAFEAQAGKAADPKLKEFIATVQPVVANHLQMAKTIRQNEKTAG